MTIMFQFFDSAIRPEKYDRNISTLKKIEIKFKNNKNQWFIFKFYF